LIVGNVILYWLELGRKMAGGRRDRSERWIYPKMLEARAENQNLTGEVTHAKLKKSSRHGEEAQDQPNR
jgi:hypothetical protein